MRRLALVIVLSCVAAVAARARPAEGEPGFRAVSIPLIAEGKPDARDDDATQASWQAIDAFLAAHVK